MRTLVPALLLAAACAGTRVRPAVLLPMSSPSRDPSPIRNAVQATAPPPIEESDRPAFDPPPRLRRAVELAATLAASLAGALPIVELVGTFEENEMFEPTTDSRPAAAPTDPEQPPVAPPPAPPRPPWLPPPPPPP